MKRNHTPYPGRVRRKSYCPLVPNGAKAKVTSAGNCFAVNVFGEDAATVAEIKKRAETLKGAPAK